MSLWCASATSLLELAAGRNIFPFKPGTLPSVLMIHIDAYTKHSRWVPRLQQYCIMTQSSFVDDIILADEGTINVETLTLKWKNCQTGECVKKLCSSIAHGMTIVNKRFNHPITEKGHPSFPSLASGELAPIVIEMMTSKYTSQMPSIKMNDILGKSIIGNNSTLSIIKPISKPVKQTLLDFSKLNDSPCNSDIENSTIQSNSIHKPSSTVEPFPILKSWITKKSRTVNGFQFLANRKKRFIEDSVRRKGGIKLLIIYL